MRPIREIAHEVLASRATFDLADDTERAAVEFSGLLATPTGAEE